MYRPSFAGRQAGPWVKLGKHGGLANENPPGLLGDDAQGRGAMVAFHPAYHACRPRW
ncbi:MAG: hypothetical protein ACREDY_08665 [Bradyrhizobium sp.]